MNTDTLFELGVNLSKGLRDDDKDIAKVLSHTNDPITSYEAAERANLNDQEYEVYIAIQNYGGKDFTAKELSEKSGLNYWTIQRRLSGLRNKGKIKRVQYRENTSPETFVLHYSKREGCCVWKLFYRS